MQSSVPETLPSFLKDKLNPPQLEAVRHFRGPILVLAGAGSGKTRILTYRVAHLILEYGIAPERILAVTFTNKAAEEMKTRLRALLGDKAEQLWMSTFHSAALRMLRRHAPLLGYSNDFLVYDDQDSKNTLKAIIKELNIDEKRFSVQLFSSIIDQAKNANITAEQYSAQHKDFQGKLGAQVYLAYQQALMKSNAMDFGDLLVNALRLLHIPDILRLYQHSIEFVLVDEYQDTNRVQYEFIRLISAPRNNLLVVGDDDQSIYAFRGATIRNILEFEKDYPDAKVVKLEQNYRSTGNILNSAHGVIEKNLGRKSKKLWTDEGSGALLRGYVGMDEGDEAAFIAREIRNHVQRGMQYHDVAIFYRTNAQSRAIEEELIRQRIPYKIFGGLKFYERKEIKDILAYLKLLLNEADGQSFSRAINMPPRGIGPATLVNVIQFSRDRNCSLLSACFQLTENGAVGTRSKGIAQFVALMTELREDAKKLPLSQLIHKVIEITGYTAKLESGKDPGAESRIENLRELEALGRSVESSSTTPIDTLRQFLDRIALTSSADAPTEEKSAEALNPAGIGQIKAQGTVSLMTLHLAKGLEFPVVFLTGMEEGLLPHYRSLEDPEGIEEERRLCYVGITRAMKDLYLTRAESRGMFSAGGGFGTGGFYRDTSRFVFDIPKECLQSMTAPFAAKGLSDLSITASESDTDIEDDQEESYDIESGKSYKSPSRLPKKGTQYGSYKGSNRVLSNMLSTADTLTTKKRDSFKEPVNLPLATCDTLHQGARVLHKIFGEGVVEKVEMQSSDDQKDCDVYINFSGAHGSKKLILKYAKLWLL